MRRRHKRPIAIQALCEGTGALSAREGTWSSSPSGVGLLFDRSNLVVALKTDPSRPDPRPPPNYSPSIRSPDALVSLVGKLDLVVAVGSRRSGKKPRGRETGFTQLVLPGVVGWEISIFIQV